MLLPSFSDGGEEDMHRMPKASDTEVGSEMQGVPRTLSVNRSPCIKELWKIWRF